MVSVPPGSGLAGGHATAAAPETYPRKWLTMAVVAVGTFLAVLDSSMVNISLPAITRALNTDLGTVQWVVTAYLLTITSLLLSFGRLADIVGRKPVYVAGFVLFAVTSGLSGLVQNVEQLILLRAAQGVGSAMMMAISPAITTAAFPPSQRGRALGMNATVVAAGASLGPTLGGLLLGLMDWRAVFFARVPVSVLGIALSMWVLREPPMPARKQRFDLVGAALLSLSLSSLLLGLDRGQEEGWTSPLATGLLAAFALLLAAFLRVEARTPQPMVDLSLFRNRVFSAANASSMLSFLASSGTIFLMPFFLGEVQGFPPNQVGLLMTASPLLIAVAGPISGWLSDRFGSRGLASAGIAISCTSLVLLSGLGSDATAEEVFLRLALMGLGAGLFQAPNNNSIMGSVSRSHLGIAAGMLASMRNLGMAVGTAVGGTVYSTRYAHYATVGDGAFDQAASVAAFHDAYLVAAAFAAIGIFTSLVRGRNPAAGPAGVSRRLPSEPGRPGG